jgi:hypothetical protein
MGTSSGQNNLPKLSEQIVQNEHKNFEQIVSHYNF